MCDWIHLKLTQDMNQWRWRNSTTMVLSGLRTRSGTPSLNLQPNGAKAHAWVIYDVREGNYLMTTFWVCHYRRKFGPRAAFHIVDETREKWRMFVIGVTRATGKLLVTSLFKGVGTLEDAEPRRERNSTWEVQQGYKNRWEFQLEWSSLDVAQWWDFCSDRR